MDMICLNDFLTVHKKIKSIHPSLEKLQPIAFVNQDKVVVYDTNDDEFSYVVDLEFDNTSKWSSNIAASFPLHQYKNKSCVVIGENVVKEKDCFVTIFHEFVHCYQDSYREEILNKLHIYKEALKSRNYRWELDHPFPYSNEKYLRVYKEFRDALIENDTIIIKKHHANLKLLLSQIDYEYLSWQQWSEGFARHIENKIRKQLGFELNIEGEAIVNQDRIAFYAIGDIFIRYLVNQNPSAFRDILQLWHLMF